MLSQNLHKDRSKHIDIKKLIFLQVNSQHKDIKNDLTSLERCNLQGKGFEDIK